MKTPEPVSRRIRRRRFLATGAAGLGAAALSPLAAPAVYGAGFRGAAEKVRMGFIGVGGRGTSHLRTMLGVPDVEITWICDIVPARIAAAQRRVKEQTGKTPAGTESHDRVLAAKDVDAVLIATPCDVHASQYLDTIAAGKDLYGEKPMCITRSECDAVVAAAEKSKCIVQVGFQNRYNQRVREGIERMQKGDFGEILEVRASYLAHFGPLRGWKSKRAHSGDWMVEQAVHFFDIMNWALGGLPSIAYGMGRRDVFTANEPDRDVTDYYSALIEYPNGVIVNWLHSWVCPAHGTFNKNQMHFMGRKGGVDVYNGNIEYMDRRRATETLRAEDGDTTRKAHEAFLDCVRTRRAPYSGVRMGRDAVLVALLVRDAVDGRRAASMKDVR